MMPSSNRSGHPYQRFIPREEVQAVSAWTFDQVDDEARRAAEQAEAEPTLSPEQIEALRTEAFAQGFEQGRQAGAQETRDALAAPLAQQAQEHAQRFAAMLAAAQAELDAVQRLLADQVLLLACDIARQVVRRELAQPLEPLRAVVTEAVSMLTDDARPAVVRLHPEDAQRLAPLMADALADQRINLVPDERLSPGGCVIETPIGSVDATIERRWSRALSNLGLDLPWRVEDGDEHG